MNIKDQLLRAGDLGRAAFHAGQACSPVKDKKFMEFLQACDNLQAGTPSVGQAPSLALLMAWMRSWRTEEQKAETLAVRPVSVPFSPIREPAEASV